MQLLVLSCSFLGKANPELMRTENQLLPKVHPGIEPGPPLHQRGVPPKTPEDQ